MAGSAINIKANAQEVINLKRKIDELSSALASMQRSANPAHYDKLNNELQKTTIKYNNLRSEVNRYSKEQERAARSTSETSDGLVDLLKKGAAIGGISFGVAGLKSFGSELINVYGEMQMLQSSFEVLLGGKGVSGFTEELKKFAVESPLSLTGVSTAAQTLLGFGVASDKIMPTIRQIGDISMGNEEKFKSLTLAFAQMSATGKLMGQDLLQMINAGFNPLMTISEKTGKSIGELKKDMEAGSISSDMVADAFRSATSEGGKFYGMTQKQAEGINGLKAQLQGGLQDAYNKIGESQNELISGGYKLSISLVENYEAVGKAIAGLITTYGVYKAAVVFATAAESGWNTVQLITYNRLLLVEKAQKLLNATMLANPYVLTATAIVGLIVTIWALNDATTAQESAQTNLNKIIDDSKSKKDELGSKSSQLINIINSETKSIQEQILAYKELQKEHQKYLGNKSFSDFKSLSLKEQQKIIDQSAFELSGNVIEETISKYNKIIDRLNAPSGNGLKGVNEGVSVLKEISKELGIEGASANYVRETLKGTVDLLEKEKSKREEARKETELMALPESERKKILEDQLKQLENQKLLIEKQIPNIEGVKHEWTKFSPLFLSLNKQLGDVLSRIEDTKNKLSDKPVSKNKSFWEKEKKDAEDALELMDETQKGTLEWKKQLDKLNTAKVKLGIWDFSGKSEKKAETEADKAREASLRLLNIQAELDSESIKQQLEYEQKLLDIEQDSFDKRYRQNQLNMAKELIATEEFRQKMIKDQQEAAKNIYIKNNGTDTGFNFATFDKTLLPQGLSDADIEAQIKKRTDASLAAWKKGNEDLAKEQKSFADEEKLTFASQLDQQIYSIRKHYKERRDLAKGNSDLIKQIEKNESREITEARLQAHQRQLESDAEYNQKYKELTTDRYFFESDKRKASLEQQIKDQKKIFNDLEKRVMNDPNNDELARQLREAFLRLRILNKEFEKTPEQKLAEIAGIFKEITGSLSNITGVDLSMLSNAVSGIASFATGDFIGAASSGMGIVSTFITGFISQKERQAEIQREINKLQQQYNIDLRQQNYDLISSIDYARAFKDNLEALQWLIDKGFISEVDYSAWEALVKQSDEARKNFEIAKKNSDSILSDTNKTLDSLYKDFVKGSAGDAIGNQAKPIISILKDWKNGIIDNEEAFRRLGATGWKGMSDIADKIARSDEETQKWKDQIAELSQQMDEFATGTSFDSFLSDAANAISDLRGNVTSLADFTEEKLTNAILSSFKYQILSNALKPMYNELADMFLSGNYDASAANDWKQRLTDILNTNSKELDKIFSAFGIDPKEVGSSSQTPSSGYSVSMSQDTGDKLVGIQTGSQMRLISLDQNVARIAQWNQPVSEKFNFDTIAMPLGVLSQSSLRIERMMEENRNIQMQMFYKVSDIEKWSRVLPQMNEVLGQMNGKLDNI